MAPQLATLVREPPEGPKWVHEVKFDGYRLLARIDDGRVRLVTRANNDWTERFEALCPPLASLPCTNAMLDGEVVHAEADGTMSFHALQNVMRTGESRRLQYYAFDLLFLDGEDLRAKPLEERKALLKKLLRKKTPSIHYSEHFAENGAKFLQRACAMRLEGIVSKRLDASYRSGRGEAWLKSKCIQEQELVVGGFTIQPKHPTQLGAFLTGYFQKGALVFAGKVGTGFSKSEGRGLLEKLKGIEQAARPFQVIPADQARGARFVRPDLVIAVRFSEWTPDGLMRHPSYQGLREDKPAREVVREKPEKS